MHHLQFSKSRMAVRQGETWEQVQMSSWPGPRRPGQFGPIFGRAKPIGQTYRPTRPRPSHNQDLARLGVVAHRARPAILSPAQLGPTQHMLKKIEPKGPHLFFIWQVLSQQIKSLALYCTTYTKESTHPLWAFCCSIIQQKALPDLLNIHTAQVRWPNQSLVGQGEGMLYVNFSSSELVSSPQEGRNVAKRMRPQEGMLWL